MRRIRLIVGAAAVVVAVAGPASAAWAAEAETGAEPEIAHAEEECIHLLEEGGTIDDCQEAPNPLLPETNEIIWGSIAFVIVFGFLSVYGYPAAKKAMEARTATIQGEIDSAERSRSEAEALLGQYRAQLAEARAEAGRIIDEARQSAEALRRELTTRAEAEAEELRRRNADQVEGERQRVLAEVQGQVSTLAIDLAERVVGANLDRDANLRLIEDYINSLGAGAGAGGTA